MPHLTRFGAAAFAACCVLGLASLAADAQTQSANAPATRARSPEDAAVADRVSQRLNADPNHLYRHVTVSVNDGVVTLGGLAGSSGAIESAKKIAGGTPGVSRVQERIQLEREGPNTPGH
jgi:osmotically-inducible protein OsmY